MTPNTDRPTPRDLIEAPATKAGNRLFDWIDEWQQMDAYPNTLRMIRAIEDETRHNVVAQIRRLAEHHGDIRLPDGRLVIDLSRLRLLLEEVRVARHGRSSDPEPAPSDEIRWHHHGDCPHNGEVETAALRRGREAAEWHRYLHAEGILVPDEGEECGPWHHRVFIGADPALQAAGEPPYSTHALPLNIAGRMTDSANDQVFRAGATGEGETP